MLLQSLLRPVLTPIMRGIFDPAQSVSAAWSPLSLWPDGILSPGMWISPRDLTSQWQDYTGTTPVSVPGTVADSANPVGLALDIRAGATVLTDPGNHMLQSTSVDRPLLSAYDGQTLGPGDTYDSTGYPIAQLYNGTNSGMATAAFAAGTLTSSMDCMIAVRRDSDKEFVILSSGWDYLGYVNDLAAGNTAVQGSGAAVTVWVDGAQVAGGVAVTAAALGTALTLGDWHIVEFRNADLSGWVAVASMYLMNQPGYVAAGARGDIMLYPSTDPTEDKDAARQWLADYYGVTLP